MLYSALIYQADPLTVAASTMRETQFDLNQKILKFTPQLEDVQAQSEEKLASNFVIWSWTIYFASLSGLSLVEFGCEVSVRIQFLKSIKLLWIICCQYASGINALWSIVNGYFISGLSFKKSLRVPYSTMNLTSVWSKRLTWSSVISKDSL